MYIGRPAGKDHKCRRRERQHVIAMHLLISELNTAIGKSQSRDPNAETEQSGPNEADECTTQVQSKDTIDPNIQIASKKKKTKV